MLQTQENLDIWESLISYTEQKPLNFNMLVREYDIKKLQLHKINALQLRNKRRELEQRHWEQEEQQSKSWLQNQYRLFVWFLLAYMKFSNKQPENLDQNDWLLIGNCFKKFPYVCQYFCLSLRKIHTDLWTEEQDLFVQKMMESDMNRKWTSIGLQLFKVTQGRKLRRPKSIRQRWLSHLNPQIKKSQWTLQQQLDLIQRIRSCGKKWSKIARDLGNRSEHTVKNRFHKIVLRFKKKYEEGIQEHSQQKILQFIQQQYKREYNQRNPAKTAKQEKVMQDSVTNINMSNLIYEPKLVYPFNNTTVLTPIYFVFGNFGNI